MAKALHILDRKTRADMLDQLALLAGANDVAVSPGPVPRRSLGMPIAAFHRPLGSPRLAGWPMRPYARQADVIHAWSLDAMRAGAELALAARKPMVISLPAAGPRRDVAAVRQVVGAGLFSATVPTRAARAALIRSGLPEHAVHVLPPAAAEMPDRPAVRRRVREALGVAEDEKVVVAPDPMVRHAGHAIASWAHAIVRQVLGSVSLLFPGGGPHAAHVRFFAGTTGYNSEVFFPGERWTVGEALAAADVAVLFHEREVGVGTLAAAMAAGLPIAASRLNDVAELAPDGEGALLVEAGDPRAAAAALLRLLEDADLAERLAAAAQRRAAEAFAPQRCRKRLGEIYAATIEARVY